MNVRKRTQRAGSERLTRFMVSALSAVACWGLLDPAEATAATGWVHRANNMKVVVSGDGVAHGSVDSAWAWALSGEVGQSGGQKVLIGDIFSAGNGENPYYQWFADGGAEATSLVFQSRYYLPNGTGAGHPWAVGIDSSVWYRTPAGWYFMPNNRCEGAGAPITIRQVVGDNAIAVGYNSNIYVIESSGSPSNSIRWWSGSCWWRLPTPPSPPTDVAVWSVPAGHDQDTMPWIATTSGTFYRWNGSSWIALTTGWGLGVASHGAVIGMDGTSFFRIDGTETFHRDLLWPGHPIRNIGGSEWLVTTDGRAFSLE